MYFKLLFLTAINTRDDTFNNNPTHLRHWIFQCVWIKAPILFFLYMRDVRCQVSHLTCHLSPVSCHMSHVTWHQCQHLQPQTLPMIISPVFTSGCCCWSLPRPINNEAQWPENECFSARQIFIICEQKYQICAPMSCHYFFLMNHLVIGQTFCDRQTLLHTFFWISWRML